MIGADVFGPPTWSGDGGDHVVALGKGLRVEVQIRLDRPDCRYGRRLGRFAARVRDHGLTARRQVANLIRERLASLLTGGHEALLGVGVDYEAHPSAASIAGSAVLRG